MKDRRVVDFLGKCEEKQIKGAIRRFSLGQKTARGFLITFTANPKSFTRD